MFRHAGVLSEGIAEAELICARDGADSGVAEILDTGVRGAEPRL